MSVQYDSDWSLNTPNSVKVSEEDFENAPVRGIREAPSLKYGLWLCAYS
jgi:hypothetical protein